MKYSIWKDNQNEVYFVIPNYKIEEVYFISKAIIFNASDMEFAELKTLVKYLEEEEFKKILMKMCPDSLIVEEGYYKKEELKILSDFKYSVIFECKVDFKRIEDLDVHELYNYDFIYNGKFSLEAFIEDFSQEKIYIKAFKYQRKGEYFFETHYLELDLCSEKELEVVASSEFAREDYVNRREDWEDKKEEDLEMIDISKLGCRSLIFKNNKNKYIGVVINKNNSFYMNTSDENDPEIYLETDSKEEIFKVFNIKI